MTAWRDVEVAAAEALDGPTEADLEAIRAADFTVEAVQEREAVTDHDVAAFVDVLARLGGPCRTLDPLRADLLRRARHGARAAAAARRASRSWPARAPTRRRWPSGRASTRARCASGAPTACTPSRPRSGSSSPASRWRRHRNAERLERAFAQAATGAISGAVGTYATLGPDFERARAGAARAGRRAGLHPGRPARPPRRAAERDRARRRRAGALRPGDPPPPAHRGARGRGAVPRGPEGLERDAAQAQPDHHGAHLRAGPRAARLRAGGAGERRPLARARHLALRRRAGDPARRDDPARLHAAPGHARRARHGRARRPHGAPTSS